MDFDPRDIDSRDDDRHGLDRERGGRESCDGDRDWDDWRQPHCNRRQFASSRATSSDAELLGPGASQRQ